METIRVSRDRLNAYRLRRQCLEPRGENLPAVLEALGCLPNREAALLALAVRLPGFDPAELTRLVFAERAFIEMAVFRDQTLLMPTSIAVAALRCPAPQRKESAEKALAAAGLIAAQRLALRYGVVEVLERGPLGAAELLERLEDAGGDVERLVVRKGVLAAVLTLLMVEGQVIRANLSGDLIHGKVSYALAEQFLGGEEVTGLDPEEAVRALCAFYFRVHGPATLADFGFWSGTGPDEAAAAFREIRPTLARVDVEGIPYGLWLPEALAEELSTFETGLSRPVTLVPFRDPWLTCHEGRIGRFLSAEDFPRLLPGPALPAVLLTGFAAGRFELNPGPGTARVHWFRPAPEALAARADEIAAEVAAFAATHLRDLAPLTVPCREGPVVVYG